MRDRVDVIGEQRGASEDRANTSHLLRRRTVDRKNARMRVRRAHHRRVSEAGRIMVRGVVSLSGEKPQILLAPNRLADALARLPAAHSKSPVLARILRAGA